ncbi:MAG: 16S rRNA (cytosine(967)-C(5))-methyltransferase RsmB [Clostridia bacterium]|nr:16S rRNA (cytosine(967)-C(5))-methyltransferase RsmB [Clostridia bacterium]MBR3129725.1 16S rRNA (cytosine(967)-C(5))-methyltransferase RsmB [Clostridia bacterium]
MLSVRRAALETLVSIFEDGAYANLALKDAARTAAPSDVPYLYALVNETIVRGAYLDYVLSHFCKRQKRTVRNLLRMAGTELLFLNTPSHAVVNESVSLCREVGKAPSAGLVNAVLRRLDRERDALPPLPDDPEERLSIAYGVPRFLVREWLASYGEAETEALLMRKPVGTEVRAQYPFTTEELLEALPVGAERRPLDPNCVRLRESFDLEHSDLFLSGRLAVQNEGAMLICRALGDVREKKILDACAAPGGKTAYLASLSENTAELTAWELHPHRKALLDATLNRLHVRANTACIDATEPQEAYCGAFDAVLLDVPCSGFGLLADKPDVRLNKSERTIAELTGIQDRILDVCSRCVKRNGVLVYATCTISKRENGERVRAFLSAHPAFRLVSERQLLPTRDGTNGFYYAVLTED